MTVDSWSLPSPEDEHRGEHRVEESGGASLGRNGPSPQPFGSWVGHDGGRQGRVGRYVATEVGGEEWAGASRSEVSGRDGLRWFSERKGDLRDSQRRIIRTSTRGEEETVRLKRSYGVNKHYKDRDFRQETVELGERSTGVGS